MPESVDSRMRHQIRDLKAERDAAADEVARLTADVGLLQDNLHTQIRINAEEPWGPAECERLRQELARVQSRHVSVDEELQRRHDAVTPLQAAIDRLRERFTEEAERAEAAEAEVARLRDAGLQLAADTATESALKDAALRQAQALLDANTAAMDAAGTEIERLRAMSARHFEWFEAARADAGNAGQAVERLQARVKELETGIRKFLDPSGPEAFGLERLPFDPDDYPISFDTLDSHKPR